LTGKYPTNVIWLRGQAESFPNFEADPLHLFAFLFLKLFSKTPFFFNKFKGKSI
jgi:hypothetical protein